MTHEKLKKRLASIPIPETHRKISDLIGIDAMVDLCFVHSKENLYIPMISPLHLILRRARIQKDYCDGLSSSTIARKYRVTIRTIQRIVYSDEPMYPCKEVDCSDIRDILPIEALPDSYTDLIEIIGARNTFILCEAYGGDNKYIPGFETLLQCAGMI